MREAAENGFAGWGFYKVIDEEGEQDQDGVGEPGVEGGEMKALGDLVDVKKLVDVEVDEVEAVAALADEQERTPGEERREQVRAA